MDCKIKLATDDFLYDMPPPKKGAENMESRMPWKKTPEETHHIGGNSKY